MKTANILTAVMLSSVATGPALADIDTCYVPISEWQPRSVVKTFAEEQGWKVRRIKVDDGCYEIFGWDSEGQSIEVEVDPATLEIVKMSIEAYHASDSDDEEEN